MRVLALLLVLALLAGCSKDKPGEAAQEAAFHQPVIEALEKAGFDEPAVEETTAGPYRAEACVRGEIEQLDVLICRYSDEAAAKGGEESMRPFLDGAVSGAIRRAGLLLLAVADRQKSDLAGKSINKLLAAFDSTAPKS